MADASQFWTINGATFASNYLGKVKRDLKSTAVSRVDFTASGRNIIAAPLFAFGQAVTIQRNGAAWFSGKAIDPNVQGSQDAQNHQYAIVDAWYDLERVWYQQAWKMASGTTTLVTTQLALIVLFAATDGSGNPILGTISAQAQVINALQYAIAAGVNLQIGTIDLNFFPPTDTVNSINCAEVIKKALKYAPDAVCYFDYSTAPPTLNIKRRANLTPANLKIKSPADQTGTVKSAAIRSLIENVPAGIIIQYARPDSWNGGTAWFLSTDVAPPGITPKLNVPIIPIQLTGGSTTQVFQAITCTPIVTTSTAFWQRKCPQIFSATGITINKGPYNATAPAFPNEITKGSWAAWIGTNNNYQVAEQTIQALVDVTFTDSEGRVRQVVGMPISCPVTCTNAVTGLYANTTLNAVGEPVPAAGLAAAFLAACSVPQYTGSVEIEEVEVSSSATLANVLNLANGKATWATMNAMITAIEEDVDTGNTHVTIGPAPHISVADMIELANVARWRNVGYPGSYMLRLDPSTGTGNTLLPDTSAKYNGAGSLGGDVKTVLVDPNSDNSITHDSPNGLIKLDDGGGTTITAKLGDIPEGQAAKFQQCQVCVGGVLKTAYVLMTTPA